MASPLEPPAILYLAGSNWDAIAGTDRRLVGALSAQATVIWVDPPISFLRRGIDGTRLRGPRLSRPIDRVVRVHTAGPPGLTRPLARSIARAVTAVQVRHSLRRLKARPQAVVQAFASGRFPRDVDGNRVLYVTDDWVGGAELMGFSRWDLTRTLRRNAAAADVVLAVSPPLADLVERITGKVTGILPNGGEPASTLPDPPDAGAPAVLVGQLNERLDLDILERITADGLAVRVVGPRAARDPIFARRLEAWLFSPGVEWLGAQPYEALAAVFATASVGLTPYADTEFNRSSFPLKTLEYLGSGLPVVSTNLPAAHWLDAGADVAIAEHAENFVALVRDRIVTGRESADDKRRVALARIHSWDERALRLLDIVGEIQRSTRIPTGGSFLDQPLSPRRNGRSRVARAQGGSE